MNVPLTENIDIKVSIQSKPYGTDKSSSEFDFRNIIYVINYEKSFEN